MTVQNEYRTLWFLFALIKDETQISQSKYLLKTRQCYFWVPIPVSKNFYAINAFKAIGIANVVIRSLHSD